MKVQILPFDSFAHGRQSFVRGEPQMVNQADANDLVAAGLAEFTGEEAQDDMDDVLGEKMEPITSNKMEPTSENKARTRK